MREPSLCELPAGPAEFDRPWNDGAGTDRGRTCSGLSAKPEQDPKSVFVASTLVVRESTVGALRKRTCKHNEYPNKQLHILLAIYDSPTL